MRRAFTLIELVIVTGIISALSTGVFMVIAPQRHLGAATDVQRQHSIKELQNAEFQYLIDHGKFAADRALPIVETSARPLCRFGVTDASCINVDALVGGYIACIPYDSAEINALFTGYTVFVDSGRIQVRSTHLGTGVAQHTCENAASSSSSVSSTSMSVSSSSSAFSSSSSALSMSYPSSSSSSWDMPLSSSSSDEYSSALSMSSPSSVAFSSSSSSSSLGMSYSSSSSASSCYSGCSQSYCDGCASIGELCFHNPDPMYDLDACVDNNPVMISNVRQDGWLPCCSQ